MDQTTDRGTVRLVIALIGTLGVALAGAVVFLVATNPGVDVPEQMWLILTALVSCLVTLATTRSRPSDAPDVYSDTLTTLRRPNTEMQPPGTPAHAEPDGTGGVWPGKA